MESTLEILAPIWTPHPGQEAFLSCDAKSRVLACGRRWGKSDACAAEIVASLITEPHASILVLAPTQVQATIIFDRVVALYEALGETNELPPMKVRRTPYANLQVGGRKLAARSGRVGHYLRGNEATHIYVDEAAFVPAETITDVAMPMLATTHGRLTMISTPNGMNHFWRFFRMGEQSEHGVWSRTAPSQENPVISPEFLATQRALISDRAYRVEYEAEFIDSSGRIFRTEHLERAVRPRLPAITGNAVAIGIDWARYSDETAVVVLRGSSDEFVVERIESWSLLSWSEQVARVARLIGQFPNARVLCDATGVGDPVLEMLQRQCPSAAIEGLVFTAPEKQRLIDELVWAFERDALRMLPHPELMRQLTHYEGTVGRTGHVRLGATSGFHDDIVTALALAVRELPTPYRVLIQSSGPRQFSQPDPPTQGDNHDQAF